MKASLRRTLFLLSSIVLAVNCMLGFVVYKSNNKLLDSEQWVQHTLLVINKADDVLALNRDMETASDGFIITRDKSFLEPLYAAPKKISVYLQQLKNLTADNPSQQKRIDSLYAYIKSYLAFSLKNVEKRKKQMSGSGMAYTATKQGKLYTDRILQITQSIWREENSLLLKRKHANVNSAVVFNRTTTVMLALMATFTCLLLLVTGKYLLQNKEKEKRAAELVIANEELLFQNDEKEKRAAELVIANEELLYQNQEKEKRAAELKRANRLYAFISEINQNIVREKDELGLFSNACSIAHNYGKFKIAWIGLFNDDQKAITQIAQTGIPKDAIAQFDNVPLQPDGPQSQVLLTGKYFICNDITNDAELEGWGAFAVKQKVNSCIILPIKKSAKIIGTFNLYAAGGNFSNKEELALLMEVTGDISFALDMFEREKVLTRTQNLVIENEKRFHSMIEKSTDMITLSKPTGEFIYASGSVTAGLGYSVDELLQMSVFDILHPDDIPGALQNREIILKAAGESVDYEQRRKHKNGNWIWCEGSQTNMLNEPGIHALVSNFRDVSEKKTAEIRREYDKNNMDALMNNSNDLMWSVGRDFQMITSNKPFDDFMKENAGKSSKQGGNILKTSAKNKQLTLYQNFYQRAFAGGSFTEVVYSDLPVDNWAEISFCPIRNAHEVIGTACHSHDITERKLAEAERNKLVNDLLTRNIDLEQFAYVISHNLRAPVANIIGATSMMNDPDLSEDDRNKFSHGISTSAKKLDEVISDLNNILTVKTKINESWQHVNFKLLVEDIKHSIQNLVERNDVEIIYDFKIDEFFTLKAYLYSIFYNLISNSIKYRRHNVHTRIEIKSRLVKDKLKLVFIDNGRGIDLQKNGGDVFGLYKRFHTNLEGKGMGLFMVKTQVEALGGKISLKSIENKGTEFTIEFEI